MLARKLWQMSRGDMGANILKLLWDPFSKQRRQVLGMYEMVLQRPWQCYLLSHRQPSSPCQTQGSPTPPSFGSRRNHSRMLQLWYEERFPPRFHSRQIRYRCGPPLPSTLRVYTILEGYELGYFEVATSHRRPIFPPMACVCPNRCRATARKTSHPSHDCQVGGNVEG